MLQRAKIYIFVYIEIAQSHEQQLVCYSIYKVNYVILSCKNISNLIAY